MHLLPKLFAFRSHYRQFALELFLKTLCECNVGFAHRIDVLVNSFFRVRDFNLGSHESGFLLVCVLGHNHCGPLLLPRRKHTLQVDAAHRLDLLNLGRYLIKFCLRLEKKVLESVTFSDHLHHKCRRLFH